MKRTLCMLLALVMLLACSAMSTAVADDLPEAEVKMWVIGPGEQADADVVKERLNQILNEQVPNTKLTLSLIDGNGYEDMLSKALAASERIDIAWTGWMHNLTNMAFEGSLLPLNDLVTNYGQDIAAFLGEEGIKLHQLADGELYQIISWQGLMGNRQGLYLPTELVNEMPEGWQDELQAAYYAIANGDHSDAAYQKLVDTFEIYPKTLQEKGKLMRGLYIDALHSLQVGVDAIGVNGDLCYVAKGDDTFTVKPADSAEMGTIRYAKLMADFYKKGYIQSDIASVTQTIQWKDQLTESDYIMSAHAALDENVGERLSAQFGMPISIVYIQPNCEWVTGKDTGLSLPYTCKEPEHAMMIINELYRNPEFYRTFVYGIEGQHWVDNGDGTATTLCGAGQATSEWAYGQWKWTVGTCMNALITQADTAGYYEGLKAMEATAYANPFLNFRFDNSAVVTEQSNLNSVYEEYHPMMWRGYLGDDAEAKAEEFIAKLSAAGIDTYIAEYQRQIDEYVKANNCKW